jgi:formyltetrahydrofolate-dependent phosphoribosylglycinamide formyltransferase
VITLAVLVSGSGTTLQNLIDRIAAGTLDARIAIVIASRDGLASEARALKAGLRYEVVRRRDFDSLDAFSDRIFGLLDEGRVDLACCAGWLALLKIAPRYYHRVINVHPSLLPAFGGQGMYGQHVHKAVLDHGCKVSGCTVHFLDDQYDSGPIILQRTCPVLDGDDADALAHRVQEQERIAYPEAIELIARKQLIVDVRRVRRREQP